MRVSLGLVISLVFVVVIAGPGCGRRYYRTIEAPRMKTQAFRHVQILDLEFEDYLQTVPPAQQPKYRSVVAQGSGIMQAEATRYLQNSFLVTLDADQPDTLVVHTHLKEFHPGSRAGRYFSGGLGGRGVMRIRVTLYDGNTSERVGAADAVGEIRGGYYGGNAMGMFKQGGLGIAQFILDHHH